MTHEASDHVIYEGDRWLLVGADLAGLFHAGAHGLVSRGFCTANYRGFTVGYACEDERLRVVSCEIFLDPSPPALFGHPPEPSRWPIPGLVVYRHFPDPWPLTGALVLGRGDAPRHGAAFALSSVIHAGPVDCAEVLRLDFDAGRLRARTDLTPLVDALRREGRAFHTARPEPDPSGPGRDWESDLLLTWRERFGPDVKALAALAGDAFHDYVMRGRHPDVLVTPDPVA